MKSLLPRVTLTSLALGVCAAGYAQDPVPIEFYRPLKNSVSIGVRMIGGNAKVNFSGIGNIPSSLQPDLNGSTTRVYDNGIVYADGPRTAEVNNTDTDNDGTLDAYRSIAVSTTEDKKTETTTTISRVDLAGGRYQQVQNVTVKNLETNTVVSSTDKILGEFLSYRDGETRGWGYNLPSQTVPGVGGGGTVDMSVYSVSPSGAQAQAESDASEGVELQFAHIFKRYKRFEWGINFSAGGSSINAKTRKQVRANLLTTTDRYTLANTSKFPNYAFYDSTDDSTSISYDTGQIDDDGNAITYEYPYENDHYLNRAAQRIRDNEVTANGAAVDGYWQIKGAYYLLRVGPIVRVPIGKKWTITAGAGGAVAYIGSRFVVDEYVQFSDVVGPIRVKGEGEDKATVGGYYADVNIERWLTVRTGFFAGYSVEKMGSYTHELGGRKAEVDLGTSGGFRFGVITRF